MFDIVLLNVVFIVVPILLYLLYIVYENVIEKKGNNLFLGLAILSALYLITKYSLYFNYSTDIIKILLLMTMLKNKGRLSILVALFLSIYFGITNNNNILLIILEYGLQIFLFFIIFKNSKKEYKLLIFILIEIAFGIILDNSSILTTIFTNIFYSLIGFLIVKLMDKIENIIDIYGTIRQVEYEKNFRDSLFKVTHEIKNPIAVCKGYLDMLDTNNEKQVSKYIPIIKQEIDRSLTLMNDFLNLTRLSINKTILDVSLLIDDVSNAVESLLIGKNIHFMCDTVDDEVYIDGDYDRLKQVLINLIKNSMESIENEKIGVIKLKMLVKKEKVLISLEDNGKGMSKETLQKIGEPFFTTKEKGTGLGVKLSTEIIELHNGTIKYNSKINNGTIVKIELPLYEHN